MLNYSENRAGYFIMNLRQSLLSVLLIAAPCVALAQEAPASSLSWEVSAVSDYLFRGASQTDENATLQANATWTSASGIYLSGGLSGVDFGAGKPNMEVDYTIGYARDLSDNAALDISLNRYSYPGANELSYNEFLATTTFAETYSVTVGYSNDVWNTGTTGLYYGVGGEWGLPNDFSFSANVGRSVFRDKAAVEADDYTDWSVAVGKSIGLFNVSLGYYGTDGNGRNNFGKLADNRLLLTVSISN